MLEAVLIVFVLIAAVLMGIGVIADFLSSYVGTIVNTYALGTFVVLVLFGMALEASHYQVSTKAIPLLATRSP